MHYALFLLFFFRSLLFPRTIFRVMTECILDITSLAYRGRGVARREGKVVLVPGVIPGERVRVRIVRSHKKYDEAETVSVELAAPARCEPVCPYAGQCPGCCCQHMAYATELEWKDRQLSGFLRQLAVPPEGRRAPVPAPQPLYYRNKLVLHASAAGGWGYVGADNRTVLPVRQCALAVPEINEALGRMCEQGAGAVQPGERMVFRHAVDRPVLCWKAGQAPDTCLTESTPFGDIQVAADGFFQVNRSVADLLIRAVMQVIREVQPDAVLDLFCGCGIFALAAAACGVPRVAGVDLDAAAIHLARRNAEALHAAAVQFTAAPADRALREWAERGDGVKRLWLVDPPRQGLNNPTIEWLLKHRPEHLLYISCAPDTLARDLTRLCADAYRVEQVGLFDMFPRTYGFETMVLLSGGHSR